MNIYESLPATSPESEGHSWIGHFLRDITTGFRFFAECLRYSAKAKLYSAKPLPSAALDKEHTVKNWSAKPFLPSVFYRALGKEKRLSWCRPRWCSLYRVPTLQALGKDFLFLFFKISLLSALYSALGKDVLFFFPKILSRVPPGRRSAKFEFFFKKNSLLSALWPALGKVWIFF